MEGLVAAILNDREVALNIGAVDGVELGMKFDILGPEPLTVIDPATGVPLGVVDRVKIKVKVAAVHDRFSIARTFETYRVNEGGTGSVLGMASIPSITSMFTPPRWVTRVKTLRYDDSDLPGDLSEEDSIVRIGDRVSLITSDSIADESDIARLSGS